MYDAALANYVPSAKYQAAMVPGSTCTSTSTACPRQSLRGGLFFADKDGAWAKAPARADGCSARAVLAAGVQDFMQRSKAKAKAAMHGVSAVASAGTAASASVPRVPGSSSVAQTAKQLRANLKLLKAEAKQLQKIVSAAKKAEAQLVGAPRTVLRLPCRARPPFAPHTRIAQRGSF